MSEIQYVKMKCSVCKEEGHNKRTCEKRSSVSKDETTSVREVEALLGELELNENSTRVVSVQEPDVDTTPDELPSKVEQTSEDPYTKELLKEQYALHKAYVNGRIATTKNVGVKVRLPSIPEDISENIVKQIIHNKLGDRTSRWDCKAGDLQSQKEGKQECKCFTSDGPPSFTPSSNWDIIYFLDAREWLADRFILYRVSLKRTSPEWQSLRMSKTQTFQDQTNQGRRPRINWPSLYPQIESHCSKVYEGTFDDIFTPLVAVE